MISRLVFIYLAFVLSFAASSVSYEEFIVPRLSGVHSVPGWWWLLCAGPVIGLGIYVGWKVGRIKSAFSLSFIGGVAYVTVLQFTGQGFHDLETGTHRHYMQLVASSIVVFTCLFFVVGLSGILHALFRVKNT